MQRKASEFIFINEPMVYLLFLLVCRSTWPLLLRHCEWIGYKVFPSCPFIESPKKWFCICVFTEIKAVVDLIPKPREPLLLPRGNPGCICCAVVATGGILNGSRMGKEIDAHDYVFRSVGPLWSVCVWCVCVSLCVLL